MYSWKGESLSKLLLVGLVFIVIINSFIIIGIQVMIGYPYHNLMETRAAYDGYAVIDNSGDAMLSAFLLGTSGKENRLIVTEKHFAANRYRVILDTEVTRDYTATVHGHIGKVTVGLNGDSSISIFTFRSVSLPVRISTLHFRVPVSFLVWSLLLLGMEILVAVLCHKIRT